MENVNWQAYYHPGGGGAPIIQGNAVLDMLKQQYQQRQQQKAQENDEFTKEIAKLNFNGARDAELPAQQKGYSDILGTYSKLRTSNDPQERAQLSLQLRQQQNQFLYGIEQSKQRGEKERQLADLAHNPNVELQDGALDKIAALTKIGDSKQWDKAYNDLQGNLFVPKEDPIKMATEIAKGVSKTTTTTSQKYNPLTGRMENTQVTGTDIDHDKFVNGWVAAHSNKPSLISQAIRETGEADPAKAVLKQAEQMYGVVGGSGKSSEKTTSGAMTMGNIEKLQTHSAEVHNALSPSQQPTPFTTTLKNLRTADATTQKGIADHIAALIPTKGRNGQRAYATVENGVPVIHVPEMYISKFNSSPAHDIPIDLTNDNYPDIVQTQLKQDGVDVNGYNQANKGAKAVMPQHAQQQSKTPKQITSQADYEALPKGTQYIAPNGKVYIKK